MGTPLFFNDTNVPSPLPLAIFDIKCYLVGNFVAMEFPLFIEQEFIHQDFTHNPLPKGEYENCVFSQCRMANSFLDSQVFLECRFEACDLSHARLAHSSLREVRFKDCKLLGVDFEKCDPLLFSVDFENCKLDYASFYGRTLKDTSFADCQLAHVDFTGANLTKAVFDRADLSMAVFQGCDLSGADFRSALNFDIDPGANKLAKCRFASDGLAGLLKKHDIVID